MTISYRLHVITISSVIGFILLGGAPMQTGHVDHVVEPKRPDAGTHLVMPIMDPKHERIRLTGQELADLIAFAHSERIQHNFTEADLTPKAREMMDHEHGGEPAEAAHAEEIGHHHEAGEEHHQE